MPHKLPTPTRAAIVAFQPTRTMIKPHAGRWYLRARQTTEIGNTWVTLAAFRTHADAIRAANELANPTLRFPTRWPPEEETTPT